MVKNRSNHQRHCSRDFYVTLASIFVLPRESSILKSPIVAESHEVMTLVRSPPPPPFLAALSYLPPPAEFNILSILREIREAGEVCEAAETLKIYRPMFRTDR